jgi:hypothetical protein
MNMPQMIPRHENTRPTVIMILRRRVPNHSPKEEEIDDDTEALHGKGNQEAGHGTFSNTVGCNR